MSADNKGVMKMYDVRSNELVQHYDAHNKEITSLVIDKTSKYCVSVGKDCNIKIWDLRKGGLKRNQHKCDRRTQ